MASDKVDVFQGKSYKCNGTEVKIGRHAVVIISGGIMSMQTVLTEDSFNNLKTIFRQIEEDNEKDRQVQESLDNLKNGVRI